MRDEAQREAAHLARMVKLRKLTIEEVRALIAVTPKQFRQFARSMGWGTALAALRSRQRIWTHFELLLARRARRR